MTMTTITTPACGLCQVPSQMTVDEDGYRDYQRGKPLALALLDLTPAEQSLITSGTHDGCHQELQDLDEFGEDE